MGFGIVLGLWNQCSNIMLHFTVAVARPEKQKVKLFRWDWQGDGVHADGWVNVVVTARCCFSSKVGRLGGSAKGSSHSTSSCNVIQLS